MRISASSSWSGGATPLQHMNLLNAQTSWGDDVQTYLLPLLKTATPKVTGMMALKETSRRTTSGSGNGVRVEFAAHSSYAPYVIGGARPHAIYPVAARYLHFFSRGREIFVGPRGSGAHVNHPGNAPNDFPNRVLADAKSTLMQMLQDHIRAALEGGS